MVPWYFVILFFFQVCPKPNQAAIYTAVNGGGTDYFAMLSNTVLSAHGTIAEFCGVNKNVASFAVKTYLRYALLQIDGEGMREQFWLDLSTADDQVKELAEVQDGVLSDVVADLECGDCVQLDWIQVKHSGKVVRQIQALGRLSSTDEKMLRRQFPVPQIMSRKVDGKNMFDMKSASISASSDHNASMLCQPCNTLAEIPVLEPEKTSLTKHVVRKYSIAIILAISLRFVLQKM